MSPPRKGKRRHQVSQSGGSATPPPRTRLSGSDIDSGPVELPGLSVLDHLLGPLDDMRFASPLDAELFGSFVLTALAESDEPDMVDSMIGFLAEHASRGARVAIDALRLFAVFARGANAELAAQVCSAVGTRMTPPRWSDSVGRATVESAQVFEHPTGDGYNICLRLRYPQASTAHLLGAYVDVILGGMAKDIVAFPDADEYQRLFLAGDGNMTTRPMPLAEAKARLTHALWITDHTLAAPITEDFATDRLLLDHYLAIIPDEGYELPDAEPLTENERERLVEHFLAGPEAMPLRDSAPPFDDDQLRFLARLAVDFAADFAGGDPTRWTPSVVESFLMWVPRKVAAPRDRLDQVPMFLRAFVPFAHREKGWGDRYLTDTLGAIDDVADEYRAALREEHDWGPGNQLIMAAVIAGVDPTDGESLTRFIEQHNTLASVEHPEPMNWQSIPSGLRPLLEEILAEVESLCDEALDDEYVTLARRLTAALGRKRPTPLTRGRPSIWAGAILYALAQINWLFDNSSKPTLSATALTSHFDGSHSAIVNKAREIRSLCKLDGFPSPSEYTRAELRMW
jgi:hypothetical protein